MSLKGRIAATVASLMLVGGGLSLSTLTGEAYNCGAGTVNGQKDGFYQNGSTYFEHHWLGYCWNASGQVLYYAGNDSHYGDGSLHPISSIQANLRGWNCWGSLTYDYTSTQYNTGSNTLHSPWFCGPLNGPDADSNDNATQNGLFSWWHYLNYNDGTSPMVSPVGTPSTSQIAGLSLTQGTSKEQPAKISAKQARTAAEAKLLKFPVRLKGLVAISTNHSSALLGVTDGHATENFSGAINAWVIEFDAPSQNDWTTVRGFVVVNAQTGVIESASLAESN